MLKNLEQFEGINVVINTTEDCNLRCKYCYETCKTPKTVKLEDCKKFLKSIISNIDKFPASDNKKYLKNALVFEFIGGDALMDVDLLEELFRYVTALMGQTNKFPGGYRFNISTNGTLFSIPKVRQFCEKWKKNLHVGVSIDGCPEIHDLNRVFPNGRGSMAEIRKNWEWFRKTFPVGSSGTKATCNRDSIPYLYESLKFMHEELGLTYIFQNFIMEDAGITDEDLVVLEEQLMKCKDYMLSHRDELYWGIIIEEELLNKDFVRCQSEVRCGSGWMPTLGINGNVYPCFRWLPPSQNGKSIMTSGPVREDGTLDFSSFIEVQEHSNKYLCSPKECIECEYEHFCPYCIAGGYAETGDFKRVTHICGVTKLIGKISKLYWEEYHEADRN